MTTFTPGPWLIYQHPFTPEPSWFDIFTLQDGEEMDIAENVTAANARLIAAAPALYEALRDMREGWRYIRERHGDLYGVGWDRAEQAADAALAAAKGGA